MAAKNEAKVKFTAETGDFNAAIKKSKDTMGALSAELKLNEAQMKASGASVEGLQKKAQLLSDKHKEQQNVVEALNSKYDKAVEIYGENSTEATKLSAQLANAQAAEVKMRQAVDDCNKELQAQIAAKNRTESATDKLSKKINEQESELKELKKAYSDAVLELGDTSDEAKDLANKITDLSGELSDNKKKMDSASDAADDLDESLKKTEKSSKDAGDGFTVAKGALASLVADGIKEAVSPLKEFAFEADKAFSSFAAATGVSKIEMSKFKDEMNDLYANNYGESMQDIAEAMATVAKSTQETDPSTIKELTKNAIALRDTFGYEVNESIRSVKAMMTNFGISGDEAFNLIVQGAQNGLDYSDEMIDSINEYSVQFAKLGLNADDMFNIFAEGAKSGAWNLDKVGDAVKEFSIRAIDGSKTTIEAYESLNLNAEEMMQTFAKGGDGAKEAFQKVIKKLVEVDDKVQRDAIGVQLFGTMWEDLGVEAVKSLASTNKSIDKTKKSMDKLDDTKYDNIESQIKTLGRTFKNDLSKTVEKEVVPSMSNFFKKIQDDGTVSKFSSGVSNLAKTILPPLASALKFCAENIDILTGVVLGAVTAWASFKAVMAVTTAVTAAKTAIAGLSAGVGVATKAQALWNAAMSANPIGAVITAVGLLAAGIAILCGGTDEATEAQSNLTKEEQEFIDQTSEVSSAYKERREEAQKVTNEEIANVDYVKNSLLPQLQNLVDANGEVKKGEEGRANFILGELNKALGTEYSQLSDIVDANGKIKDSIYDVIEAKKVQIYMQSAEEAYTEAINEVANAEKERAIRQKDYATQQEIYDKAYTQAVNARAALDERAANAKTEADYRALSAEAQRVSNLEANAEKEKKVLDEKKSAYDTAELNVQMYYSNIDNYTIASTLVQEGKTNEALQLLERLSSGFLTTEQARAEAAEKGKSTMQEQNEYAAQKLKEQAELYDSNLAWLEQTYKEKQTNMTEAEKIEWENRIANAKIQAENAWQEYYNVGGKSADGLKLGAESQQENIWSTYSNISKTGAERFLSPENRFGFVNAGKNTVDDITQGAGAKQDSLWTKFKKIGEIGASSFGTENKTLFENAGKTTLDGITRGVNNNSLVKQGFANTALAGAQEFKNKKSEFTGAGENALWGIKVGLDNGNARGGLLGSMASLGTSLLNRFKKSLTIASPSKKFAELAKFIPEGVAKGIEDNTDVATDAIDGMNAQVIGAFSGNNNQLIKRAGIETSINANMSTAIDKSMGSFNIARLIDSIEHLADRAIEFNINGHKFAMATAMDTDGVSGGRMTLRNRGLAVK